MKCQWSDEFKKRLWHSVKMRFGLRSLIGAGSVGINSTTEKSEGFSGQKCRIDLIITAVENLSLTGEGVIQPLLEWDVFWLTLPCNAHWGIWKKLECFIEIVGFRDADFHGSSAVNSCTWREWSDEPGNDSLGWCWCQSKGNTHWKTTCVCVYICIHTYIYIHIIFSSTQKPGNSLDFR